MSTALSREARADTVIAVDADGALPTTPNSLLDGGGGFGVRLGSQLHLPLIRVTGEIGYGYERLLHDRAPSDWNTHRFTAGARVGLGELLVPFAFAHAGYGWRSTADDSYGGGGLAVDAGIGLDVNLGLIALGGHIGYAAIDARPSTPQWVILGLDAAIVLP